MMWGKLPKGRKRAKKVLIRRSVLSCNTMTRAGHSLTTSAVNLMTEPVGE